MQTSIHSFFIVVMLKHSLQSEIRVPALLLDFVAIFSTPTTDSYLQQLSHSLNTLDVNTYIFMNL